MKKYDMTGFNYENGSKIQFDGVYGRVELMYFADEHSEFFGDKPSHFKAFLMENGRPVNFGEGIGPETAVISLYEDKAKFDALKDLGSI